jgi:hypothetical protein
MNHFNQIPEFEKELLKLKKKYRSLPEDIEKLEKLLLQNPLGLGKNFTILHYGESLKIIKARLACRSLRGRSIRLIYAYHGDILTFVYIEIYCKSYKDNEDKERVKEYISKFKNSPKQ